MKTDLSDDQAQQILRHYNLRLKQRWPLRRGTINSNYLVQTDAGPLFLRINEGKNAEDAAFEAALIWHLGSRGVRTPALWRTRCGAAYVPLPGPGAPAPPVMLLNFVPGNECTDGEITAADAQKVGVLLAELHLGAADLGKHRTGIYTLTHIEKRISTLQADARARAELGPVLEELRLEAARLQTARQRDLPTGIGHGDLFPDNLLFAKGRARPASFWGQGGGWILDLEQAATISYAYDLAVSLLAFCAPVPPNPDEPRLGPLRPDAARALLAGYQTLRLLSPAEWSGLYEELRYAALRFTVTRLTDVAGYGQVQSHRAVNFAERQAEAQPKVQMAEELPPFFQHRPIHSKDYRDFLWRLRALSTVDGAVLKDALCQSLANQTS